MEIKRLLIYQYHGKFCLGTFFLLLKKNYHIHFTYLGRYHNNLFFFSGFLLPQHHFVRFHPEYGHIISKRVKILLFLIHKNTSVTPTFDNFAT